MCMWEYGVADEVMWLGTPAMAAIAELKIKMINDKKVKVNT